MKVGVLHIALMCCIKIKAYLSRFTYIVKSLFWVDTANGPFEKDVYALNFAILNYFVILNVRNYARLWLLGDFKNIVECVLDPPKVSSLL
uniref:Putative ovule protein n=1 Tax=Solanum chacoense TaxID=4108 RepID=A0A0V0I1J0_SOLCH